MTKKNNNNTDDGRGKMSDILVVMVLLCRMAACSSLRISTDQVQNDART